MNKKDVLRKFFRGDEIKVFPLARNIEPFSMPRQMVSKVFPLMVASAMLFTACSKKDNAKPENGPKQATNELKVQNEDAYNQDDTFILDNAEWGNVYREAVDKYQLTQQIDREPLSPRQIEDLMNTTQVPLLRDTNFNHIPEDENNFWEIVYNGLAVTKEVQQSPALTMQEKKAYQIMAYKMLSQISKLKGSKVSIDLTDYNNLKTFLYFEKVVQYRDSYSQVMNASKYIINEQSEFLGRYYKDYLNFQKKAEKVPEIEKFAQFLYYDNSSRFMLTYADSVAANDISRKILAKWLKDNRIKDENLWYYTSIDKDITANNTSFYYSRGKNFRAKVAIDSQGKALGGYYTPVGLAAIHETQHLGQRKPASNEAASDNGEKVVYPEALYNPYLNELGPTLYTLALSDAIYKEIHHIDSNTVLDYGAIDMGTHKVKTGELAVWFKQMIDKYPRSSVDKILAQDEVFQKLKEFSLGRTSNTIISQKQLQR